MKTVGVRQLKENLSRYLNEVKSGETIVVTDRKKEIALIVPYGLEADEERVLRMIQRGLADWAGGKPSGMESRVRSSGEKVSEAVLEDRR